MRLGAQLTLTEKINDGKEFPLGTCPVCQLDRRIMRDNRMYRHGARANPCRGTYQVARGLTLKVT